MIISYDIVIGAFLTKITEFELLRLVEEDRNGILDGYLKRAASNFGKVCTYDLSQRDDELREFVTTFEESDADEIIDILSEGMLVSWLKPYVYKQELLENVMNTNDFSVYSPAELLLRVSNTYSKAQKDFTQMMREYSFSHGDLTELHL